MLVTINSMAQTNTFPSGDNVGIGTTSPRSLLHINGLATINTPSSGTAARFIGRSATDGSEMDFYANNNLTLLGYIEFKNTDTGLVQNQVKGPGKENLSN